MGICAILMVIVILISHDAFCHDLMLKAGSTKYC